MRYIIGNWKSNKTESEIREWVFGFKKYLDNDAINFSNLEVIVCPPFIYLPIFSNLCKENRLPIKIGAQNISPFNEGAYTGEVSNRMLSDYASYVLIGHSERRKYFSEEEFLLFEKVERAREANLTPIYCIQDEKTPIPKEVKFIAYEPIFAIGTGQADTPANSNNVGKIIKEKIPDSIFIYGGSVTGENVAGFLSTSTIDGVLPGKASLDPNVFGEIIRNASILK